MLSRVLSVASVSARVCACMHACVCEPLVLPRPRCCSSSTQGQFTGREGGEWQAALGWHSLRSAPGRVHPPLACNDPPPARCFQGQRCTDCFVQKHAGCAKKPKQWLLSDVVPRPRGIEHASSSFVLGPPYPRPLGYRRVIAIAREMPSASSFLIQPPLTTTLLGTGIAGDRYTSAVPLPMEIKEPVSKVG